MSVTVADLRAKIAVDGAEKAKADLKGVHETMSGTGGLIDAFKNGLGTVTGFLTGFAGFQLAGDAVGFLKDQFADLLQVGMDQQKVEAQTNAVLASTHSKAGQTAQGIADLADHWAQLTGISNDSIQSMENVELTFTNIKGNIFPQTTEAVLNVATAMHEDLQSAAVQVGKAMNDPAVGMTALQRIGVTFTESQKKTAAQLEATGHMAAAQGIVLGELDKEFGKSAQAAGQTLPGQLSVLNEKWEEAKEKVAGVVIPVLADLVSKYVIPAADWLGQFLPRAIQVTTDFLNHDLVPAINGIMSSPVVTTLEGWATAISGTLDPALDAMKQKSDAAGKSAGNIKGGTDTANKGLDSLSHHTQTTGGDLDPTFTKHIDVVMKKLGAFDDALDGPKGTTTHLDIVNARLAKADAALDGTSNSLHKTSQAADNSTPVLTGLGDAFGNLWQKTQDAGAALADFAAGVGERLGPALPTLQAIFSSISDDFSMFTDGVHHVWDGFWGTLTAPVRIAFDSLKAVVNVQLDLLGGQWKKADKDAETGFNQIVQDLKDFAASVGSILLGLGQSILGWILAPLKEMWKDGKPYLDNFGKQFQQWWRDLIPNLERTIDDWARQIQQYINDHMPHFPGINFPSINLPGRASGGPISGNFIGAEDGVELLVTPGVYHAPPGSYVYNAQQTSALLSGTGSSASARSGNTYVTNVYPQQATIDTQQLARIQRRRELLTGMY